MNEVSQVFFNNKHAFFYAVIAQLQLSFIALLIGSLLAILIAILATRYKHLAAFLLPLGDMTRLFPALALLGIFLAAVPSNFIATLFVLILYTFLYVLYYSYHGFAEIDPALDDMASALDMNKMRKLLTYKLPMARPQIMHGVYLAGISVMATITVASILGIDGLGTFILQGIQENNRPLLLLSSVSAGLLVIVSSIFIYFLGKFSLKKITGILLILSFIFVGSLFYTNNQQDTRELVIAGKSDIQSTLLAYMEKELISANSDITVSIKENFGGSSTLYQALCLGQIDMYSDFSNLVLENMPTVQTSTMLANNSSNFETARQQVLEQDNLAYLQPFGQQKAYKLGVKKDFAEEYDLHNISDLHKIADQLMGGFTVDFLTSSDGYLKLKQDYDLAMASQTLESSRVYQALNEDTVNLISISSEDKEVEKQNVIVLGDDLQVFQTYQYAPLLKVETLKKFPELEQIINQLAEKVDEQDMREMTYKVGVEGKDARRVAKAFLVTNGLLD